MQHLLPIIAAANFAAGLSQRALDPVIPQISQQLLISIPIAASLVSAAAFSYTVMQLPVGVIADLYGKPRLIVICLLLIGIGNLIGTFATSFEVLFASRLLCGIAAGGTFPVAIGLVAEIFPLEKRRVALSRVTAGSLTAQLAGASLSGLLGDLVGWRGVLAVIGFLVLSCSTVAIWGFRHHLKPAHKPIDIDRLKQTYSRIIVHPNARIVYFGMFTEGTCIAGIFPYIASFLHDQGEQRLFIAGLVIGGYAVGGLVYSAVVPYLLRFISDKGLMRTGGLLTGSQIIIIGFGPPWQVQLVNMFVVGLGFFGLHAGLQLFNSEIAPDARATAVSMSSTFYNSGVFVGPLMYGVLLTYLGRAPALLIGGSVMIAVCLLCTVLLKFHEPDESRQAT